MRFATRVCIAAMAIAAVNSPANAVDVSSSDESAPTEEKVAAQVVQARSVARHWRRGGARRGSGLRGHAARDCNRKRCAITLPPSALLLVALALLKSGPTRGQVKCRRLSTSARNDEQRSHVQ